MHFLNRATIHQHRTATAAWLLALSIGILTAACSRIPIVAPTVETPVSAPGPVPSASPSPSEPPPTEPAPSPTPTLTPTVPTPTQTATATPAAQPPHLGLEYEGYARDEVLSVIDQAGARWLRINGLIWQDVEPWRGTRNWNAVAALEESLQASAEAGIEVILIIRGTPPWARSVPGATCGPVRRENVEDFAAFLRDAVARYSAPPFNVRYWELWNEPDIRATVIPISQAYGCWGDARDPNFGGGYYAEMLQSAYPAIKSIDPEAQVLVGGLLLDCDPVIPPEVPVGSGVIKDCTSSRFLTGILENGGGDYFDGVSFHAYDFYFGEPLNYSNPNWHSASNTTGPVLIAKTRYLRSVLDQFGYPGKLLMNTEVAVLCGRSGREAPCRSDEFAATKAAYAAQANAAARAEGLTANIWYSLRGWRASGLVGADLAPLPAYHSFQYSASRLQEAAFLGEIIEFPGVRGYEFYRSGYRIWVLWSRDGQSRTIELPVPDAAVYNMYGDPLPAGSLLEITLSPLYLEWQP